MNDGHDTMGWTLGKFVTRVYVTLWITAVGGVLGANIAGTIGSLFFIAENKIEFVRPWWHGGWYIGTVLFFVGAACGKLRMIQGTSLAGFKSREQSPKFVSNHVAAQEGQEGSPWERDFVARVSLNRRLRSFAKGIFVGGLAGGFLGILLGGSLLVFWMSIAYSPFAPSRPSTAIASHQGEESQGGQRRLRQTGARAVIRSRDQVSLYLCLVPTALGIACGAIGLGTVALIYPEEQK